MKINTPEELVDKLEILEENLPLYKNDVDVTDDDISIVSRDKVNLSFALSKSEIVEIDKQACNAIKVHIYSGSEVESVAAYPIFSNAARPADFTGGCKKRYLELVRRIKASSGYTKEIGIALGIEDTTPSASPDSVVPTLVVHPAKFGYQAAIVVGNRGESRMWKVFLRRLNSETQTEIASGTGKSADITITPTTDGLPEMGELTVRLYKNNLPYGQPSNPVPVTVSP